MSGSKTKQGWKRQLAALLVVVITPVAASGFVMRGRGADRGARVFQEVLTLVQSRGVDSISSDSLYENAARGLVRNLGDPYAELFSPEELADFTRQALRGEYGGLGILIELQGDTTTVMRVYPNTPAAAGGVMAGDRIVAIEDTSAVGWKLDKISSHLMGPAGTPVNVTFVRYGVAQPFRSRFIRAKVHVPAVPFTLVLPGGVGYVALQQFSNTSGTEMEQALRSLRERGARSFILDLRGNSGGSVQQSVQISNLFLRQGAPILTVRYRSQPADVYTAEQQPLLPREPLVVLTDGYAASASEIVAGALQDHDRALLIGQTTFGKGLVQDLFRLDDGWALKLTTGKWYTPSGRSIQRPRKLLPDGSLVIDTAAIRGDSARGVAKPVFRSVGGRTVYGGGGITPDIEVKPDTLVQAEKEFMAAIAPKAQQVYRILNELVLELRPTLRPGFTLQPQWRDRFFRRMSEAGVPIRREQFYAATPLVNRLIEDRLATVAFGDSAAFRRGIPRDLPMQRALTLLRGVQTQSQLFARAASLAGAPTAKADRVRRVAAGGAAAAPR